jgi:hypothetical protein
MIWFMALPLRRFIVSKHVSRHLHRPPTLLFVNGEARAIALKHYTKLSINTDCVHEIRERYIDFGVDAFAYNTVNPSWAFSISNDIFADDKLAKQSFQTEITNKVCTIVIPLGELKVQSFERQLCEIGFCKGLLPSLREMIFYVHDISTGSAAKRKLRKRRLQKLRLQEEEMFHRIKTGFDKWVGECQHCVKYNQERSIINKPLKLTFATCPSGEFASGLVPVQEYPGGKYCIPAE